MLLFQYIDCREGIMKKITLIAVFIMLRCFITSACANASAVEINAPEQAKNGAVITISVNVIHSGNNIFHYTDWVWIKVNDKEIGRWDFTWNNRPESNDFTRQVTFTVKGPLKITAKANCNLHGSAGEGSATVKAGQTGREP
jgi:desulfoferrodoxin (superoxide reductase-like protein)